MAQALNRRQFLKLFGLTAVSAATAHRILANPTAEKHPNIVFVMADDLGYGDVSCYNPNSKIPTPSIDRLAGEGIRFTDAHSPSAVCTPTRYGVLTGRYCWRTWLSRGVIEGDGAPLIEPHRLTIASMLKQHGYRTACIGKWHLGLDWTFHKGKEPPEEERRRDGYWKYIDFAKPFRGGPTDLGFDYFFGTPACPSDDYLWCYVENDHVVGTPRRLEQRIQAPDWRHEDVDTTFTSKATTFIENHAARYPKRPFFLYLPLSVPHAPWKPPQFVKGKSQAGPRGDQVVLADWCVQQILKTLKRLRLADNTLVIFTSDNGPRIGVNGHKSAWKLRGYKSHAWEGGHRIPFIARWPGKIRPKTISNEPIELTDMMATFASIAGHKLPSDAGEDSYNVLPALLGTTTKHIRKALIQHSCWGAFTIRKGKWKLILGTKGSGGWVNPRDKDPDESTPGQLYDIAEDPYETKDLWDAHPEVVAELRALLDKYKKDGRSAPLHTAAT
ncbi:N-acetylgalactosamine-6-O-sulfatase [subsurface metagenome]